MKSFAKQVALYSIGWGFIFLGIAGLFLPVLQGILFLLVGLTVLSFVSPRAASLLHRVRERFPGISRKVDEAKDRAQRVRDRLLRRSGQTTPSDNQP